MRYKVFYMKPHFFRDGCMGYDWLKQHNMVPTKETLDQTHTELKTIDCSSLSMVFHNMQAEIWAADGKAGEMISSRGLTHTSMSVGDIAVNEDGQAFIVDRFRWQVLWT